MDRHCTNTSSSSCTKECKILHSNTCPTKWYARYARHDSGPVLAWRCFAKEALTPDMTRYDTNVKSSCWKDTDALNDIQKGNRVATSVFLLLLVSRTLTVQ